MHLTSLPKFTYCNGTELTAKLCYFYKHAQKTIVIRPSKRDGGRREVKRILVLVGKIYDILVRDGYCKFVCCWYNRYRHKTINDVPECSLKDSIQVLRNFLNVRLDNRCGNMLIIGKYGVLKPLMLVWKKGSMQGFPRDVIRYLSQWL